MITEKNNPIETLKVELLIFLYLTLLMKKTMLLVKDKKDKKLA